MNILQTTLGFPPAYALGGPVKTTYSICRELLRRGHKVTVYCSNLADKNAKLTYKTTEKKIDGIRAVYFNTWNIRKWPGTLGPVWFPDLRSYLLRELANFDVVHINGYRNLIHLPVSRAAVRQGIPIIVQPHGSLPIIINSFFLKRLYDRILGQAELKGLSALVALQQSEVRQAIAQGVPRKRIHTIPNGMDPKDRDDLPETGRFRAKYHVPEKSRLILFVGRINPKKGVDMLVKAFDDMNSNLDTRLVIAGPDDGQLLAVKTLVKRFELDKRVIFTGLLSHQEVLEAFVDADLYVLPCRSDTFPMAMVEACFTNTPMVVTDRCEISHLVKNRVAEVVPFDPVCFCRAMEELINNRSRYEAYRSACPELLESVFSVRAVADKVEDLYHKVLSEARNAKKNA